MSSSDDASQPPAWDVDPSEPEGPAVEPVEDHFSRTGIANLHVPARFTIACLGLYVALRCFGLLGEGIFESAQHTSRDLVYGEFFHLVLNLWGMTGLVTLGFGLPLMICTALAFLTWLVGAAHNAETIDQIHLRISPGWQAGWYFAPFFHLIMPVLGMVEIITHSHLRRPESATFIVLLWWSTWILGTFGIYIARIVDPPLAFEFSYSLYRSILDVSAAILTSCAAILLIILIQRVTKSQTAVAESWIANEGEEDPFEGSAL